MFSIGNCDLGEKVLVVAEIGNNHEGDSDLAKKMIELAAQAGVGAVKFQTFITDYYVAGSNEDRYRKLESFRLSFREFQELRDCAADQGVIFLSTPFDLESAAFLNDLVPAFKISSGDNTFYPLLAAVARTAKPIILSTGLSPVGEINRAIRIIREIWDSECSEEGDSMGDLALLHCVSSYPVPDDQAELFKIRALENLLNSSWLERYLGTGMRTTVGYSDHTLGIEAAVLSVAVGARIVEKHFTISKDFSDFQDHRLSADPKEMKDLVVRIKRVEELIRAESLLTRPQCEQGNSSALRRSIVAKRDLLAGKVLEFEDLVWTRPAGGLAPGQEKKLVGRSLVRGVKAGDQIDLGMVK